MDALRDRDRSERPCAGGAESMQAMRVGQGKNCSRASAACTSELCTALRSYKPLPGYYQTTSTQRIYFRECGPGPLGAAPGCLGVATGLRSSAELPVAVSQRWADSLTHCACCACCALRTRRAMGWWFPFRATSVATPPKSPKRRWTPSAPCRAALK